jgi:3-dehydroquinate synthase
MIATHSDNVLFFEDIAHLGLDLQNICTPYSQVLVLCDENTLETCLPPLMEHCLSLTQAEIIVVEPGESSKSFEIAQQIFQQLIESNVDKRALLINLGGGMVTDLGGWVAANYKRGISCVHVPTTLLGMVDAALGGKNGLDLGDYKNMIGVIRFPINTLICPSFLTTLDEAEIQNGRAEMMKHALLTSEEAYLHCLGKSKQKEEITLEDIIASASTKLNIVAVDPFEINMRKALNLGHSIGHAFESHFLALGKPLAHGTAVSAGLVVELLIAKEMDLNPNLPVDAIASALINTFQLNLHTWPNWNDIAHFLKNDKKNSNGHIKMALLREFGQCEAQVDVEPEIITQSLISFQQLISQH